MAECKCGRPHHYSIHGNCLRCFGKAPQPKHGPGRETLSRGWTGSKLRLKAREMKKVGK